MNCANHPNIAATAFCRACGKPLCPSCTRDVQGVIYCESCLAERLQGVHPPALTDIGFRPVSTGPGGSGSGPNAALAGILAGFFPFGVGAVYTGQYAKGLAHLVTFTLLVWGESVIRNDGINTILGLCIAFFYVYQIIDSVKSAHAIRAGLPPPDPFGLAAMFGGSENRAYVAPGSAAPYAVAAGTTEAPRLQKIPTAAIVLIGLGCLFLLQTAGVFEFNADRIWPIAVIALGGWLLARNSGWLGSPYRRDGTSRNRGLVGPVVLITVGALSMLDRMNGLSWDRTWPVLLLAIGITKLLERKQPQQTAMPPAASMPQGMENPPAGVIPPPTEVNRG